MKKLFAIISIPIRILIQTFLMSHLFVAKIDAATLTNPRIIPTPSPASNSAPAGQAEAKLAPSDGRSWTRFKHKDLIFDTSQKYSLDPQLIYATIMTESDGNEFAYRFEPSLNEASYCMGQLLESTARSLGFRGKAYQLFEPGTCIDLIGRYHKQMIENYGQLSPHQLARAYNTGSPWKRPVWGHLNRFNSWYYEES
ncbi:MAG: hypothetical protein UV73_C0005G0108 [Candidatus Gottesmanbacteria bacterium GW2011_GWA2_43_14]|uniref:Transglycosylase SLT domain-containing protein n=1 Tax=Candidatus Gottesmanbacteria bacterium GW2011_GWA2_43_14 TaxID=1618443 RepID=A0A0G1FS33_9BACT|nr:MAG: hypothetical protein UV73_C0005G0108 [Candidatus Gottesmanbacteria bacterium GW2011_GWA2_43_14]